MPPAVAEPVSRASRATRVEEFDPARVRPLPDQPRKRFRGIRELADSILEVGQSTPGIVTLVTGDADHDAQLIDGERRLRACEVAGVPFRAEVRREHADGEQTFVESFAANFGKQNHDVIEISDGLARMRGAGKTLEQLGRIAGGKSGGWVSGHLSLQKLHPEVRAMMVPCEVDGEEVPPKLTYAIALLLTPVPETEQLRLARAIVKGKGMSLSAARRFVLRERSEAGDANAYLDRKRRRSIEAVESIVEDVSNRIGVYLDMPGVEINQLIDQLGNSDKRRLIESIEETAGDLQSLADAVRTRLPKLVHRPA